MSLTDSTTIESKLPHGATTVVDVVTRHAESELTNDADVIKQTLSAWDQNHAVLVPRDDGSLQLLTAFTTQEVRDYYAETMAQEFYPGGERRLIDHQGPWYELIDTELKLVKRDGDRLVDLRGVFLFATWDDGILGEICWMEPEWAKDTFEIDQPKRLTERLHAYEEARRAGDVDARLAFVEDETYTVARVAEVDGPHRDRVVARSKDELRDAWTSPGAGTVVELERLHHIVSTYYVFAVYRSVHELPDRRVARETVQLLPIGRSGRFIGELSYAMETELS